MTYSIILLILFILSLAINLFFLFKTINYKEWADREAEIRLRELLEKKEREIREDAFSRSRAVSFGKTIEKFVPFLENFPADPRDSMFLGKPIDYICFVDRNSKTKSVVKFVEIKSGKSNLNTHQQNIKEAILNKRVEWHEMNVDGLTLEEKTEQIG
jgi:predicted Holliday junction resolvase-like endonuclease